MYLTVSSAAISATFKRNSQVQLSPEIYNHLQWRGCVSRVRGMYDDEKDSFFIPSYIRVLHRPSTITAFVKLNPPPLPKGGNK